MSDVVDHWTRSRMMSGIKGKHTKPERLVRFYLHAAGLRFRLHAKHLPGTPDLVLPKYRAVVFVNGCFWHRHSGCKYASTPATRPSYWASKFSRTVSRDILVASALRKAGWRVFTIWECEARDDLGLDNLFWQLVSEA